MCSHLAHGVNAKLRKLLLLFGCDRPEFLWLFDAHHDGVLVIAERIDMGICVVLAIITKIFEAVSAQTCSSIGKALLEQSGCWIG